MNLEQHLPSGEGERFCVIKTKCAAVRLMRQAQGAAEKGEWASAFEKLQEATALIAVCDPANEAVEIGDDWFPTLARRADQ